MEQGRAPVTVRRLGATAVVTIDNPPVNALSDRVREGLREVLACVCAAPDVTSVVVTGAGSNFVAGADLREMSLPLQPPHLPDVIAVIEACDKPVVAALNGPALGGGLEIALACDGRVAHPKASVGLPETRLGLVPGAGGTQRLARLVGIAKAIELIGQAKVIGAREASAIGLVDALADDAVAEAVALSARIGKRRLTERAPAAEDAKAQEAAAEATLRRARGNAAVAVAVDLVRSAATLPIGEALVRERSAFVRLRAGEESRALRHLFFAEREAQRAVTGEAPSREIRRVAMIGGGTMGSGIAACFADAGFPVALIERDPDAVAAAAKRIDAIYDGQVRGRRLDAATAAERRGRIEPTVDWNEIGRSDLVIEAVFEDLQVKTDVFRQLDRLAAPGTILATNTSYLDVNLIGAATRRPQDVVGLHFFSPAHVMRLLEVVNAERTSPEVLAAAFRIARRIGKLPIVAGVCDGFIGNRIFSLYRREAEYLVEDGASPADVDRAIESYGFAMGPFAVSDLAGLDIAWATRKRRAATRPASERYVAIADRLCEAGRLGRKAGRGWYLYPDGASKPVPDPEVDAIIAAERAAKGIAPRQFSDDEIVRRLLAVMVNEGAKVLAERIARRASDIDLVFVNGYGFPATKGGPMYAADRRGLRDVLHDVEALDTQTAPLLRELAERGASFAAWDEERKQ